MGNKNAVAIIGSKFGKIYTSILTVDSSKCKTLVL